MLRLIDLLNAQDESSESHSPAARVGHVEPDVQTICNAFLTHAAQRVQQGRLKPITFAEYRRVIDRIPIRCLASKLNRAVLSEISDHLSVGAPSSIKKRLTIVRMILKHAFNIGLIDRPVLAAGLAVPSKAEIRRYQATKPAKLFDRSDIRSILSAVEGSWMHSAVLLGISCGFHSIDVATLTFGHIRSGFVDFPRSKTGIARKAWLWPEVEAALSAESLRGRDPARTLGKSFEPIFRNAFGSPLIVEHETGTRTNSIARAWRQYNLPNSFSWLRHTFRTIADESGDNAAVRRIMGHELPGMDQIYVQKISDERLKAVGQYVREWLLG